MPMALQTAEALGTGLDGLKAAVSVALASRTGRRWDWAGAWLMARTSRLIVVSETPNRWAKAHCTPRVPWPL